MKDTEVAKVAANPHCAEIHTAASGSQDVGPNLDAEEASLASQSNDAVLRSVPLDYSLHSAPFGLFSALSSSGLFSSAKGRWRPRGAAVGILENPRRVRSRPALRITVLLLLGSVQMSCRAIDLSVRLPGTGPVPMAMQLLFGGNSNGSRKMSFMLGSRRSRHTNFEWELRVPRRRRLLRRMLAVGKARGTAETGGGQGRRLRQF